jgi:pyruvate/2-oxoglutarate dehydrogenase complex dihydrolipoamide acyltransferase (E2) component
MRGTANWRGGRSIAAVGAILLLLVAAPSRADDASEADKLREQLRATVMQLRELQDQQAAAKPSASPPPPASASPNEAALKARLSAAQARLRAAQHDAAGAAAARADADKAKADLAALQTTAAATQAELDKFKAAFNQAADQGRTVAGERDQLKSQLATETTIAQTCQAKNERLTTFAEDLLNRYDHIMLGEKLIAREPVVGFTRVHLENIAQDREDTIRAAHCDARIDALPPKSAAK